MHQARPPPRVSAEDPTKIELFHGGEFIITDYILLAGGKSLVMAKNTNGDLLSCPTTMFNIINSFCEPQTTYRYYSCYHRVTSVTLTIRFVFDRHAAASVWYFDDVSAIENGVEERIINGGFESNSTGWIIETPSYSTIDTYVDRKPGFAHTGLAYLYRQSEGHSIPIQQTINVTIGAFLRVSFWWRNDGRLKSANSCRALEFLIT